MAMQLRVEDRLQGAQNFPIWKERITRILDVSDAEEHIDSTKVVPIDHLGWGEGPHSPSPFREEDHIRNVEGFGRSLPEQERKPKDGAAGEVA